jgi:hypothetical protein
MFRSLHYINKPPWNSSGHELLISESVPEFTTSDDDQREGLYRHLRDLYLECGWDVDTVEQTAFRRDDFLVKRRGFLNGLFGARANLWGDADHS